MKISIVTAYYNRKKLFINTLKSIIKTKYENFELVVVDDASDEEHRLEDLISEYPFLKLIRLEKKDKWYVNSCIPFNVGFKHADGDIIIIQNPECFHTSDIISYVAENLNKDDYFSFACYSLNENNTHKLLENIDIIDNFSYVNIPMRFTGDDSWYNHSIYRPTEYHFASAIYKEKLNELNGFDERYAHGIDYDDNEFLHRVKKICNSKIIDDKIVLHQYHYTSPRGPNFMELNNRNRNLYFNYTLNENKIKVNN